MTHLEPILHKCERLTFAFCSSDAETTESLPPESSIADDTRAVVHTRTTAE